MTQQQRSVHQSIRLTPSEREVIKTAAASQRISAGALLRELIFSRKLPQTRTIGTDPGRLEAYQKLQPLQSNLNQLAHHLNTQARAGDSAEITRAQYKTLASAITETYKILRDLRNDLINADAKKAEEFS